MPDCPPDAIPAFDKAGHDRWWAFMKAQGVWKLADKTNAAGRAMGKAANRVLYQPTICVCTSGSGQKRPSTLTL